MSGFYGHLQQKTQGEVVKLKHYKHQLDALDKIRLLLQRASREEGFDVSRSLATIIKELNNNITARHI